MKKWYALRVVSGQENKIVKLIQTLVDDEVISLDLGDIHIPTEIVTSTRKGKQYSQKRRVLPGYILIEVDLPEAGWRNVVSDLRAIDGVIGFASSVNIGDKPQPLTEEEAKNMLRYGKGGVSAKQVIVRQSFSKGESINIVDGLFKGFVGTVESIDDQKMNLRVTVDIFGRATPIDASFNQVEKI